MEKNLAIQQKRLSPPYPRPIPQLVIEELPPGPHDLAWNLINGGRYYSDEDEYKHDEVELKRRAAKRRKIETCANACLRGQPLFIMSAQLRGPLKEDWKNPWAKRRRSDMKVKASRDKQIEIPETARRKPSTVKKPRIVDLKTESPCARIASRGTLQSNLPVKDAMLSTAPSPSASKTKKAPMVASPQVPRQVKDHRVKEWLRTNPKNADESDDEILVHSSPTPAARQWRPSKNGQVAHRPQTSQSEPSKIVSPYHKSTKTATSLQVQGFGRLSGAEKRIQQLSRNIQNIVTEPAPPSSESSYGDDAEKDRSHSSSKGRLRSSRAEYAILKTKRSGAQTAPAHAHLSPFEFKKVHDTTRQEEQRIIPTMVVDGSSPIVLRSTTNLEHDQQQPVNANRDEPEREPDHLAADTLETTAKPNDDVFLTAPQQNTISREIEAIPPNDLIVPREADHTVVSSSRNGLSNATSEMGTTDLLPSAQPRPDQDQVPSSNTHDDKLRSIKHAEGTLEHAMQTSTKAAEETSGVRLMRHEAMGSVDSRNIRDRYHETSVNAIEASTPVPVYDVSELNTQEMLANIEPLNLSTVRKPKDNATNGAPAMVTKAKSDRKRKKTSFALEASSTTLYTSIKDVMKAKVSKNLASPPRFPFSKGDLDIDVSDEDNGSKRKQSRRLPDVSRPKGILKSAHPSSSPSSTRRPQPVLSNERGHSGSALPPGSGQNGLEEEHFDFDAVLDDLGSFLGTWDAEKEASSLEMEL